MILKNLFNPGSIGNLELKNRIILPPMATALCENGGFVSRRLIDYHTARARGGSAMNIVEISGVHPTTIGNGKLGLGIYDDKFIPGLKELAASIKNAGGVPAIQLWHAGRQINSKDVLSGYIVAPSPIPCPVCRETPRELNWYELNDIIESFGDAAARAKAAGFEAVEVHGAHGYLICQFLSKYSNKREDRYGGSLENRTRFATEIIKNIRSKIGSDFPLIFRLSADEYVEEGIFIGEALEIAKIMESAGVNAIHVSAGNYQTLQYIFPPMDVEAGFNVNRAAAIREVLKIPVIAVGRINDPVLGNKIIAEGKADFVSVGRGQLTDPDFCNKALNDDFDNILKCIACNQGCIDRLFFEKTYVSCLLNPSCGREEDFRTINTERTARPKKILVAGGGPAGLEASKLLAKNGHKVILCEKSDKPGGQFLLGSLAPDKEIVAKSVLKMADLARRAGAEFRLKTEVGREVIKEINPDMVIVASGSIPAIPAALQGTVIESGGKVFVATAHDILRGEKTAGRNVAVIGGGTTGIEVAEFLAAQGKNITVIEMSSEIAAGISPLRRPFLFKKIKDLNIMVFTRAKCIQIGNGFIEAEISGIRKWFEGIETVVFACGVVPEDSLSGLLEKEGIPYFIVGDAAKPSNALDAIWSAADLALKICKEGNIAAISESGQGTRQYQPAALQDEVSPEMVSKIAEEIVRQLKIRLNIK
ncbi:MAG: oxidoreductase [Candidatus Humimicrobiaceae bacterium]